MVVMNKAVEFFRRHQFSSNVVLVDIRTKKPKAALIGLLLLATLACTAPDATPVPASTTDIQATVDAAIQTATPVPTSTTDIQATVDAAIQTALPVPTATSSPNLSATVAVPVRATIEALPTATPNLSATVAAAVQATIGAMPTATQVSMATPTSSPAPTPTRLLTATLTPISPNTPTSALDQRVLYESSDGEWLINHPSTWNLLIDTSLLVGFSDPTLSGVSLSVSRLPICYYGMADVVHDLRSWASVMSERQDIIISSFEEVTIGAYPAFEGVYHIGSGPSSFIIEVRTVIGPEAYSITATLPLSLREKYEPLMRELLYSFRPGSAADTRPIPPVPPDSSINVQAGDMLYLSSDGTRLYQGIVTNRDTYWWLFDVSVTRTFRAMAGNPVWIGVYQPNDGLVAPGDSVNYEIKFPPGVTWNTSQLSWEWKWSCKGPSTEVQ